MNIKHRIFCEEYINNGGNASDAYVKAGYSKNNPDGNAYKLLQRSDIKEYIQSEQDKSSQTLKITREEILSDLKQIKDAHKGEDKYPPHALKAIELLNKMLGFNEPEKREITVRQEPPLFSDDDLEQ